jgi:predicted Zn-dependent protease
VRAIQNKVFDLILCEYDLGVGQDGQQLLEDVRHHKLAPLSTIFIMVTAERAYAKVVSAAELAPSDYLLKPFTADTLLDRVLKALEKRKAFVEVFTHMENGAVTEALQACHHGERDYPRYAVDFMRLRAELHVVLGEAAEAEVLYQHLFELKAVAWARLGLAKTLFMQGKYQEAEQILKSLLAENKQYMDAYDLLAKTHEMMDQLPQAKKCWMLRWRYHRTGFAASPAGQNRDGIRRYRQRGRCVQKVVSRARFSEFRDPEDHLNLVDALVKKGDTNQAKTVIREMERSMAGLKKTEACRAISSALVHSKTGDERVHDEISNAVNAAREDIGLSTSAKLGLAKTCLDHNKDDHASEVILDVMKNASNQRMLSKAIGVFESAGKGHIARELAQRSQREVMELVAQGVQKAKQGDFRGSVDLMLAAARKSPDNPQVVLNAALATLKCIENMGWDSVTGEHARELIEAARRLDPMNPRLKAIRTLYEDLQRKYGLSISRK